jgi:cysteine desulfuration protein SufE
LKNLAQTPPSSLEEKIEALKEKFGALTSMEEKYLALIAMGRELPPLKNEYKIEPYLVRGCQSKLYLYSYLDQGKIFFESSADALISAGLVALLIAVYSGQSPETLLRHSPTFLHELGIYASLSPNRSHGLSHIHLRMQQDALKYIV